MNMIDFCKGFPKLSFKPGEIILKEGERTGILYILIDGCVEITREGINLNQVSEPGAIFGEVSWLLNCSHIATVKAVAPCRFHIVDNAQSFIRSNPDVGLKVATVLAQRLSSVTTHLTGVKHSLDNLMRRQTADPQVKKKRVSKPFAEPRDETFVKILYTSPFERNNTASTPVDPFRLPPAGPK